MADISVLVAEQHPAWRDLLQMKLAETFGKKSVTVVGTADEAIEAAAQKGYSAYVISGELLTQGLADRLNPMGIKQKPMYVMSALQYRVVKAKSKGLHAYDKSDDNCLTALIDQMKTDLQRG